jgi:DNA-binding SARP family transcriptional activator
MLLSETAMLRATIGDVEAAKRLYQESLARLRAEKNLVTQADTLNNLAVLYLQLGEYEQASETFEEGLACARSSRNHRAEALILAGLGDLYCEIEEFETAARAYQLAETAAAEVSGSFISNYLMLARAGLALLQNDLESASHHLSRFKKIIKLNPSGYERGLWASLEGRRHFLNNDLIKAISYLTEGKTFFFQDGRNAEYQLCAVWLIAAYERANQREQARVEFGTLMEAHGRPSHALTLGIHQAAAWLITLQNDPDISRVFAVQLERSKQLGVQLPEVRRVLRRFAQSIQMPSASLTIKGFGRPEVSVNGRTISPSDWKSQAVRDLFFHFLNRQEPRKKDQIINELWSDSDELPALRARFKQDIYRLRRAVGRDAIVFEDDTYRFNRDLDYEYDVEAFESFIYRARNVRDILERIGCYRKAVDLVDGPYLVDVDADWVLAERERLKVAYISTLEKLAQLYLDTNQLNECLDACELALEQDRYNEPVYQVEMRACAAQGDRASVARKYRELKSILAEELGFQPSEETEALYRELMQ